MQRGFQVIVVGVLALGLSACSSSKTSTEKKNDGAANPAPATWHEKMQALSQSLSRLLPLVSSRSKFNDPKNAATIEDDTRQLRTLAHSLKTGNTPNADPSLQMMSDIFGEDLDRALEGLHGGNRDYARQILKDTTSYCIQCHTQTNNGPDFPHLNLNIDTNQLTSLEQAEFFAATRQFTPALEAYQRVLSDKTLAKTDPFAWEQAARSALAIVVRVKNDPKETSSLLAKIEAHPTLPEATKRAVRVWKKSVRDWSKEPAQPLRTTADLMKKAETLIAAAQKNQEFPLDHSQDILYFRASSLLHDLLASPDRSAETTAKTLYWAGMASEATRDMNFWTLHETYYEQCIRTQPHSKQAELCFKRLKESITIGYSGSSGTQIPPDVKRRLDSLENRAGPVKEKSVEEASSGKPKN
jgi:hypothetical protein